MRQDTVRGPTRILFTLISQNDNILKIERSNIGDIDVGPIELPVSILLLVSHFFLFLRQ